MSRHSSGKKGIKKKKKFSSGSRAPKPTVILLGFLLIVVGIFGIMYNPANSVEDPVDSVEDPVDSVEDPVDSIDDPANPAEEILPWEVSDAGVLSFPQREEPVFTIQETEDLYSPENPDTLKLVSFKSKDDRIQALLRIPANASSSPGIILLPGAGVSKEDRQGLAVELSKLGYATLTPDQRDQGAINIERDLELFRAGLEPVEYLMIYGALKAADVLSIQPEIDPEKLAIIGESNRGRSAIIACALDPSLKGVIGISTSGYGIEKIDSAGITDSEAYRFYRSIDPDTYLSALPPSKFVMIHSFNDTVISHELALRTFVLAGEPKAMYNITEETHGYTASMRLYLEKELALLLK